MLFADEVCCGLSEHSDCWVFAMQFHKLLASSVRKNNTMAASIFYGAAATGAMVFGAAASLIAYRRFRSLPEAQGREIKMLEEMMHDHGVLVLSKTHCPYCTKTKELLTDLKAKYTLVELDTRADGEALQSAA
jgi:hypothetical protein